MGELDWSVTKTWGKEALWASKHNLKLRKRKITLDKACGLCYNKGTNKGKR